MAYRRQAAPAVWGVCWEGVAVVGALWRVRGLGLAVAVQALFQQVACPPSPPTDLLPLQQGRI